MRNMRGFRKLTLGIITLILPSKIWRVSFEGTSWFSL